EVQQQEERQLAEQRAKLTTAEATFTERVQETERLRAELDRENQSREEERRLFAERSARLEQAVAQLRQQQESLHEEKAGLQQPVATLTAALIEQARETSLVRAQSLRIADMQQRLLGDRQAFREREAALAKAEQVREGLQEQLRRRSEEL